MIENEDEYEETVKEYILSTAPPPQEQSTNTVPLNEDPFKLFLLVCLQNDTFTQEDKNTLFVVKLNTT